MTPIFEPTQPNQLIYGTDALRRATLYDRASFKQAFGKEAPPWDAAKPLKRWFDPNAKPGDYNYKTLHLNPAEIVAATIPGDVAATINLPGLIEYPPYVVPATSAMVNGQPFNAQLICLQADAQAVADELGAGKVFEGPLSAFPIAWGSELRRPWTLLFKGNAYFAGLLIVAKYQKGVGHSYSWDTSGSEPTVVFAPDPPDGIHTGVATSEVQPPMRDLWPNEKLVQQLMGVSVQRTDLAQPADPAAGFGPDDRVMLQHVAAQLDKMVSIFTGMGLIPKS